MLPEVDAATGLPASHDFSGETVSDKKLPATSGYSARYLAIGASISIVESTSSAISSTQLDAADFAAQAPPPPVVSMIVSPQILGAESDPSTSSPLTQIEIVTPDYPSQLHEVTLGSAISKRLNGLYPQNPGEAADTVKAIYPSFAACETFADYIWLSSVHISDSGIEKAEDALTTDKPELK